MIAFHGSPELKALAMDRIREHRELDQIIQGTYFNSDGRGCHLGCLTHAPNDAHARLGELFGIPLKVAYWLEGIFEHLPPEDCAAWVIESTEAIPVGADLSLVHHELAVWLLGPESPSAAGNADSRVSQAITDIRDLHIKAAAGESVVTDDWTLARSAARSVAWSAARSVAESATESATESAAWSVAESATESAARSVAWSAARSVAESATESAAWSATELAAWSATELAARSAAWKSVAAKSIELFAALPESIEPQPEAEDAITELTGTATV